MEAIRNKYAELGVDEYYKQHGNDYVNPHLDRLTSSVRMIKDFWKLDLTNSLDLCAGSGEITSILGCTEGCDPYTFESYTEKTGKPCMQYSFDDIMHGRLDKNYKTIVCSYALHLADRSKLPLIVYQLSLVCNEFILISPNKKPEINEDWGMTLDNQAYLNGVRIRLYKTKKP